MVQRMNESKLQEPLSWRATNYINSTTSHLSFRLFFCKEIWNSLDLKQLSFKLSSKQSSKSLPRARLLVSCWILCFGVLLVLVWDEACSQKVFARHASWPACHHVTFSDGWPDIPKKVWLRQLFFAGVIAILFGTWQADGCAIRCRVKTSADFPKITCQAKTRWIHHEIKTWWCFPNVAG